MPGKPDRSSLIPFEDEIVQLRRRRPPVPYAQIAQLLRERYNVTVCRETIFKFVKVRSRGRKVYRYRQDVPAAKKSASRPAQKLQGAGRPPAVADRTPERRSPGKLDFFPSDRYCLTRLPPEEAAAIRKKLEDTDARDSFTPGAKGETGKSTEARFPMNYVRDHGADPLLLDLDDENRTISRFLPVALQVGIKEKHSSFVQRALNGASLIIADLKARTGRERCSTGGSTEHEDVLSHGVWCFCRHKTACAVAIMVLQDCSMDLEFRNMAPQAGEANDESDG